MHTRQQKYLPFLMWLFPLLFFAYQFILRLWPGLMMHQIMEQLSIDASSFGLLAAFYYYGYAGMQIPVAMLLDRFGARCIIFISAVICGLSMLLSIYIDSFYLALLSRFLIGAGSAVGILGVSKVVSEWFPKSQYTKMIGLSITFGLLGAVYGGKPVSMLIKAYNWQSIALILASISILLGVVAYIIVRSPEKSNIEKGNEEEINVKHFTVLFSSPALWCLALSNLLMVGALEGFADVWGVPYLVAAHNFSKSDAAGIVTFIFLGMMFGGLVLAWFSKKFGSYPVLVICGLGMAFAFILLFLGNIYTWWALAVLFFVIGIMCCYQLVIFAAGSDLVNSQYLGITIAFLNCVNMLGGSFFHTMIGKAMNFFWTGAVDSGGVKIYSLEAYKYALSTIPICSAVGALVALVLGMQIRRKHGRPHLEKVLKKV